MKVILGADHAGFEIKNKIKEFLEQEGHEVVDTGAHEFNKEDDYPDLIKATAEKVAETGSKGIVFGGSGQGEAMVANKVKGIRAMTFYGPMKPTQEVDATGRQEEDPFEIVRLSRLHNNANILSIGVRFVDEETAKKAVRIWLNTEFEGGRHQRRVDKIE